MAVVIEILFPVFILIALGYCFAKGKLISDEAISGLNNFVFFFMYAGIVIFKHSGERKQLLTGDQGSSRLLSSCFVRLFLGLLIGKFVLKLSPKEQAVLAMGGSFSNLALLGFPVALEIWGMEGGRYFFQLVTFHAAFLWTITILAMELSGASKVAIGKILANIPLIVLKNPIVATIVAGVLFRSLGLTLPSFMERSLEITAQATIPCALFVLGASLTTFKIQSSLWEAFIIAVLKTAVLPVFVWFSCFFVFHLPPIAALSLTVMSASATGINVFILAAKYQLYREQVATSLLVSTILSFVSFAVIIMFFI